MHNTIVTVSSGEIAVTICLLNVMQNILIGKSRYEIDVQFLLFFFFILLHVRYRANWFSKQKGTKINGEKEPIEMKYYAKYYESDLVPVQS